MAIFPSFVLARLFMMVLVLVPLHFLNVLVVGIFLAHVILLLPVSSMCIIRHISQTNAHQIAVIGADRAS